MAWPCDYIDVNIMLGVVKTYDFIGIKVIKVSIKWQLENVTLKFQGRGGT